MNRRKPITSFGELAEHQAAHLLNQRQAILVQGGTVHKIDKSNVAGVELGGRVADTWEEE